MKGLFKYNLRPIHGGSFGYEIGIKFNNSPLVAIQNNYKTKIVNPSIIYGFDNWPKIPLNNLK